eukprot:365901-Chlamydomonas_euryale.AAC.7
MALGGQARPTHVGSPPHVAVSCLSPPHNLPHPAPRGGSFEPAPFAEATHSAKGDAQANAPPPPPPPRASPPSHPYSQFYGKSSSSWTLSWALERLIDVKSA